MRPVASLIDTGTRPNLFKDSQFSTIWKKEIVRKPLPKLVSASHIPLRRMRKIRLRVQTREKISEVDFIFLRDLFVDIILRTKYYSKNVRCVHTHRRLVPSHSSITVAILSGVHCKKKEVSCNIIQRRKCTNKNIVCAAKEIVLPPK